LSQLQVRAKWKIASPNIKEGDVVVLKDDDTKPLQWPLGVVIKVFPDPSGHVRNVLVRTKSKKPLTRSVQKIVKLPVHPAD